MLPTIHHCIRELNEQWALQHRAEGLTGEQGFLRTACLLAARACRGSVGGVLSWAFQRNPNRLHDLVRPYLLPHVRTYLLADDCYQPSRPLTANWVLLKCSFTRRWSQDEGAWLG